MLQTEILPRRVRRHQRITMGAELDADRGEVKQRYQPQAARGQNDDRRAVQACIQAAAAEALPGKGDAVPS